MGGQYRRSLINYGRLGERISKQSQDVRKSLTRRNCLNPPVGGADIAFTGKGDRVMKEA